FLTSRTSLVHRERPCAVLSASQLRVDRRELAIDVRRRAERAGLLVRRSGFHQASGPRELFGLVHGRVDLERAPLRLERGGLEAPEGVELLRRVLDPAQTP